jgi:hypothetical protein
MRLDLNTAYFKTKIIKPLQAGLAGNDVFKEYFRDCTKEWRNQEVALLMASLEL